MQTPFKHKVQGLMQNSQVNVRVHPTSLGWGGTVGCTCLNDNPMSGGPICWQTHVSGHPMTQKQEATACRILHVPLGQESLAEIAAQVRCTDDLLQMSHLSYCDIVI